MALTGVTRPGHVQLKMVDLEAGIRFYRDVLGLEETGRDAAGRVYFKTWDERDHSSVILRQADEAGLDFFGFKVLDEATLDQLEKDLQAYGVETQRKPKGDLLETGERVQFKIPSGHTIELYATKTQVDAPYGQQDPKPYTAASDRGIAPIRLDHALLYGPNVDKVLDLFTNVLGFHLTEYVTLPNSDEKGALWLACSNKAHDIAFVNHPEPGKLHHLAFFLENWSDVGHAADIMTRYDISRDVGPTRHGITRGQTIYFFDPSGNRNEVFAGGYTYYKDQPPRVWDHNNVGRGIFYYERQLNEAFLSVVT